MNKPFLTEHELLTALQAQGVIFDTYSLARLRIILIIRDLAWKAAEGLRQPWVYSPEAVVQLINYIKLRRKNIADGKWSSKHAFTTADFVEAQKQ